MSRTITKFAAAGSAAILALTFAGAALANDEGAAERGATLAINGRGNVVINHAEVTAISGSSLTVKIHGTAWTVNTTADTKVVRRFGGGSGLAEYTVGDYVNVRGAIVEGQLAVNATHVKNDSTHAAALRGTIASTTAPDTLTVSTERGVRTVKVTASTIIKVGDAIKTFADLAIGGRVMVKGFVNRQSDVLTALEIHVRP